MAHTFLPLVFATCIFFSGLGSESLVAASRGHSTPVFPRLDKLSAELPSLRQQAAERREWAQFRVDTYVAPLLREVGASCWLVSSKEYGEDPVWRSLADPTRVNARRRTVQAFCLASSSSDSTDAQPLARNSWVGFNEIWQDNVAPFLRNHGIGGGGGQLLLNSHRDINFGDGLSTGEFQAMKDFMPDCLQHTKSAPQLASYFLMLRAPGMLARYRQLQAIVWELLATAFSAQVIRPGNVTTLEDVAWWLREQTVRLGFQNGFHPSVGAQRRGVPTMLRGDVPIAEGDHLWVDFGLIGQGLVTDTQHQGYVLRKGEKVAPKGLRDGLRASNQLQDIVVSELRPGRTGNEILASSASRMRAQDLDGVIYSHPIGDHMHGAGAAIGMFDQNNGPIERTGWLQVRAPMWYSVELTVRRAVPEWGGQVVAFNQEEDVYVHESETAFVHGRQTEFHYVNWWNEGL